MFKRLLLVSIVSVNLGYTFFLFPVLGLLYPSRVPPTLSNLLAFIVIDTLWGILLAVIVYLMTRLPGISLSRAIILSILLLWMSFWLLPLLVEARTFPSLGSAIIACIDGVAALVSMSVMLKLTRRYISMKNA